MSAFGLHSGSGTPDVVRVLDAMVQDNELLKARIAELEAKAAVKKKGWDNLMELKSFQKLDKFEGHAKNCSDWEFALHRFVRPFEFAEQLMNWVKGHELVVLQSSVRRRRQNMSSCSIPRLIWRSMTSKSTASCPSYAPVPRSRLSRPRRSTTGSHEHLPGGS